MSATASRQDAGIRDVRKLPVPIPPSDEQLAIVQRLDELLATADRVANRIDEVGRLVERSSQLVLERAFHGNLTGPNGRNEG
jgi:type I restriction enzyme S subunit